MVFGKEKEVLMRALETNVLLLQQIRELEATSRKTADEMSALKIELMKALMKCQDLENELESTFDAVDAEHSGL